MSNSTLSAMRTRVRRLLNEPAAGFWTDADLNQYIQDAYEDVYRETIEKRPSYGTRVEDITFPADSESYDITTSGYTIEQILLVEDRTNRQPGITIEPADSLESLIRDTLANGLLETISTGHPYSYYFQKSESITSGVVTITQTLYVAPKPPSPRSLRLRVQGGPQDLTGGDTYTTGLPDFADTLIVYRAAMSARVQEENPSLGQLPVLLRKAEESFNRHTRGFKRGPKRVQFYDID